EVGGVPGNRSERARWSLDLTAERKRRYDARLATDVLRARRSSAAEDRRTHAHAGCTEGDRRFVVARHAHGKRGHAGLAGKLLQQREMRSGVLVDGRDAHQSHYGEPVDLTAAGDERHRLARVDAGLLGLRAGIDLHVEAQMATLLPDLFGEFYGNLVPVYRLDHIEKRYRLLRLVGLKRPDQMQLRVGKGLFECRPFGRRLLHAILTENAVTGL